MSNLFQINCIYLKYCLNIKNNILTNIGICPLDAHQVKPESHQRRGPGAGCGSAAIVVLPHQGELGQLELLCVHRQTNAFSGHKNQGHIIRVLPDSGPKDTKMSTKICKVIIYYQKVYMYFTDPLTKQFSCLLSSHLHITRLTK